MDSRILDIAGWMSEPELDWLYLIGQRLPPNSIGIELGAWKGRSSAALHVGAGGVKSIISVDTWKGNPGDPTEIVAKNVDVHSIYLQNMKNLEIDIKAYQKGLAGPQFLIMDSLEASKLFDDDSIAFLFVDDDHLRPGAALDVWLPKMSKNSIVSGHDYFICYHHIQPQVHDRLHHIHLICGSIWIRYWRTYGEGPPNWYLGISEDDPEHENTLPVS